MDSMKRQHSSWAAIAAGFALLVALAGCGGGSSSSGSSSSGGGSGNGSGTNVGIGEPGYTFMGSDKLMIGAQMDDTTAAAAPFDVRYRYLASAVPADPPACRQACSAACGGWWGCWQDHAQAPGQYALWHVQHTASATWQNAPRPQVPMFTYYVFLPASGAAEGAAEVAAMNDATVVGRYLDDWRFLLQKIGSRRAMLHIEPDLWGFVRSVNADPRAVPAKVKSGNPTDCAGNEDNAAGFARCMIGMVRKYAPNATVGLHASPWNHRANGDAETTAQFMLALGADQADFIATDPADRDAGWRQFSQGENWHWWTDADGHAYLAWSKALSERVGTPTVIWQIPLGNMAQNNTVNHWQDTRVDYFFANLDRVAASHVVALLFGAGHQEQTTPETDGGNLVNKTIANVQAGGTPLRP
jgi:hypothetical protein